MRNEKRLVQCYLQGSRGGKLLTVKIHKAQHHSVETRSQNFSCVVRGLKIALALTLVSVKVHHAGEQVYFRTHASRCR